MILVLDSIQSSPLYFQLKILKCRVTVQLDSLYQVLKIYAMAYRGRPVGPRSSGFPPPPPRVSPLDCKKVFPLISICFGYLGNKIMKPKTKPYTRAILKISSKNMLYKKKQNIFISPG